MISKYFSNWLSYLFVIWIFMDYYKILNISKDDNMDNIKKSYRKLQMKYHPDKHNGNDVMSKKINEAYAILSDDGKRREYDSPRSRAGFGGFENFPSFFEDFFKYSI